MREGAKVVESKISGADYSKADSLPGSPLSALDRYRPPRVKRETVIDMIRVIQVRRRFNRFGGYDLLSHPTFYCR